MTGAPRLLPGADRLLVEQAAELPQKDELCGAFQGLLALRAAGVAEWAGAPLDQETVALAAGSVLSPPPRTESLPPGEPGRGDYRVALPVARAGAVGTSARGLARAIEELSGGALAVVPATGTWTPAAVATLLDRALQSVAPLAAVANLDTAALWDQRADALRARSYLDGGADPGPDSAWRVGHFVTLAGVRRGASGTLVTVIDTYGSLGESGVHEQPVERIAATLRRDGRRPGGVLLVVATGRAADAEEWVRAAGVEPALWDNGSPDAANPPG